MLTLLPRGSCAILAGFETYRAFSKKAFCKADVKEPACIGVTCTRRGCGSHTESTTKSEVGLRHAQLPNTRNGKALRKTIQTEQLLLIIITYKIICNKWQYLG